ncbi:unnamed protein product [Oikopleura dioica]|uniref:Uncharacterized protein n=1 Tax=Oikopleura dioica TaxID=34765 RepID=E4YB61_OIKDI|nr:unnamed protein product [Oikopleura dioica]
MSRESSRKKRRLLRRSKMFIYISTLAKNLLKMLLKQTAWSGTVLEENLFFRHSRQMTSLASVKSSRAMTTL